MSVGTRGPSPSFGSSPPGGIISNRARACTPPLLNVVDGLGCWRAGPRACPGRRAAPLTISRAPGHGHAFMAWAGGSARLETASKSWAAVFRHGCLGRCGLARPHTNAPQAGRMALAPSNGHCAKTVLAQRSKQKSARTGRCIYTRLPQPAGARTDGQPQGHRCADLPGVSSSPRPDAARKAGAFGPPGWGRGADSWGGLTPRGNGS